MLDRLDNSTLDFSISPIILFPMSSDVLAGREIIIEFRPVGTVVRVSAMDVVTLTEAVIQGPMSAGEEILKRNALKRLEYVLRKKGLIG